MAYGTGGVFFFIKSMSISYLLILHIASVFALIGYTFYACAAGIETKRQVLMLSGIASLLVLLTGGAMLGIQHLGFPGWAIVKLLCWLGISAFGGLAYRRRGAASTFMLLTLILALVAVVMVVLKPF